MNNMKKYLPSNRTWLEKILAVQRESRNRNRVNTTGHSPRVNSLTAALFLCASLLAFLIVVQVSQTNGRINGRAGSPDAAFAVIPPSAAVILPRQICTGIPDGRLNVRETAGTVGRVIGHLMEGQAILPSERTRKIQGQTWLEITSPVTGWVNSHYVCNRKQIEK